MSLRALTWAWEQELTNPSEKLVLLAIADHANDDGMCWPSMSHVAERCLLSTRQIQRITEQLVDYGLVTRERRKRPDGTLGTYTYTLNIHRTPMSGPTGHPRPVVHRTPVSAHNRHNRTVIEPTHDHFDRFWQLYPRKIAKQKCARWWQRNTDMVSPVILTGIQRWADYWQQSNTETRYIPHPYTWLTQERWYDDPPPVTITRGTLTSGIELANELLADIEEGT